MAVLNMNRVSSTDNGSYGLYHQKVIIDIGTYSDIFLLPVLSIDEISGYIDGDGAVEFTNDDPDEIETGSPTWIEWDGFSRINTALTGFRVRRDSGTVTSKITARTKGA